ncbi:MAG: redoxin domain-containing protein [Candidatus Cloacimonetes bacterium]|nr:redoxin domain-containing protein [Candidatus Cloacimonadota bacterium]
MNSKKSIIHKFGFLIIILGLLVAFGCSAKKSSLIEMTGDNFNDLIMNELLVAAFIPANCDSCNDVLAALEEIQNEMQDVVIVMMDVKKNEQFLNQIQFHIKDGPPTVVMFSDGDIQDYFIGVESKDTIIEKINKTKATLHVWEDVEAGIVSFMDVFDFTLKDLNGNILTLSEVGGLIILDFWATWCPPCKVEIPYLVEFYNNYKNRGLTVIGVSAEDTETLINFKNDLAATGTDMNYILLTDSEREVSKMFGIKSIPTTFFISPEGKMLKKEIGFTEEFVSEFQKLIEENLPK